MTTTLAVAKLAALLAFTARTVTVGGEGTTAGAVYRPAAEIVPTTAFPPAIPFTCQITGRLALNASVPPIPTVPDGGVIETVGNCTVTSAVAVFVASATLTAVTVTCPAVNGAVNTPAGEIEPAEACHVTAVLAVNAVTDSVNTVTLAGVIVIAGATTVTVAVAIFVASAMLTAVTVTAPAIAGAVNTPAAVIEPAEACQFTAAFAANVTVPPGATVELTGVIVNGGAVTVTVAIAILEGSATLFAVTVTVPAIAGAVNTPAKETEPAEAVQVTGIFAVNVRVPPVTTEALDGETVNVGVTKLTVTAWLVTSPGPGR